MTNEWLEFQAYIKKPTYSAESKHDLSYLGRFTFKTITYTRETLTSAWNM